MKILLEKQDFEPLQCRSYSRTLQASGSAPEGKQKVEPSERENRPIDRIIDPMQLVEKIAALL